MSTPFLVIILVVYISEYLLTNYATVIVMDLISDSVPFFKAYYQGYFAAKPHFSGKLLFESFVGGYDLERERGFSGYLYICQRNLILYIRTLRYQQREIYSLNASDSFEIIEDGVQFLQEILKSNKQDKASIKINLFGNKQLTLILLNKRFILMPGIQPLEDMFLRNQGTTWSYKLSNNYSQKVVNLVTLLQSIVKGEQPKVIKPLHALGGTLAIFQIYCVVIGSVAALISLIMGFLLFLILPELYKY